MYRSNHHHFKTTFNAFGLHNAVTCSECSYIKYLFILLLNVYNLCETNSYHFFFFGDEILIIMIITDI